MVPSGVIWIELKKIHLKLIEIRSLPNGNKLFFSFLVSFVIFLWIRVNSLKIPVDVVNSYHLNDI